MVGKFSYLGQTKFSPHSMSVPVYYGGQGGQPLRMAGWANWKPGWAPWHETVPVPLVTVLLPGNRYPPSPPSTTVCLATFWTSKAVSRQ